MGLVQGQAVANAESVNLDQARKALETGQSTVRTYAIRKNIPLE